MLDSGSMSRKPFVTSADRRRWKLYSLCQTKTSKRSVRRMIPWTSGIQSTGSFRRTTKPSVLRERRVDFEYRPESAGDASLVAGERRTASQSMVGVRGVW